MLLDRDLILDTIRDEDFTDAGCRPSAGTPTSRPASSTARTPSQAPSGPSSRTSATPRQPRRCSGRAAAGPSSSRGRFDPHAARPLHADLRRDMRSLRTSSSTQKAAEHPTVPGDYIRRGKFNTSPARSPPSTGRRRPDQEQLRLGRRVPVMTFTDDKTVARTRASAASSTRRSGRADPGAGPPPRRPAVQHPFPGDVLQPGLASARQLHV